MIANADENGVVENVSLGQLALLVGLSKEQIRWNIKALLRNRYLLRYIPGGTVRGEKRRKISNIVVSGNLMTGPKPGKLFFVLVRFEMHFVLNKSIQLAIALMDSHENNLREIRKNGGAQYDLWSALYGVSDKEYACVLEHILCYWKIGTEAKLGVDRFTSAVYACVEQLIRDYGFTLSDADQQLETWANYFSSVQLANRIQWLFKTSKRTGWFIRWVFKFYKELIYMSFEKRFEMKIQSIVIKQISPSDVLIQVT